MKTDKHTVTIPIADYNELLKTNRSITEAHDNLYMHLKLLKSERIEMGIDLSRRPIAIGSQICATFPATQIHFKYEE